MNEILWKKISELIAKIGHRKIISRTFQLPNGTGQKMYDVVDDGESACVVALTKDKKVVLAEQYRPGPEKALLEIPGGAIDKEESPEEAIKRELLEETGYTGGFHYLGRTYRSAYSTGVKHFFTAENCEKISEPTPSPDEVVRVKTISLNDFLKLVNKGDMTDLDGALLGVAYFKI